MAAEEDNGGKIAVRMGVIRAMVLLTDAPADVTPDLPFLKILMGFRMAFGLGDGNKGVRNASYNTARGIGAAHGSFDGAIVFFLPGFESALSTGRLSDDTGPTESRGRAEDRRRV